MTNKHIKERKFRVLFLNIKLHPSASIETYSELLRRAFDLRMPICVRGNDCLVIKSQTEVNCSISSERQTKVLVGKFVKYTRIDGRDWFDLNAMEKVEDVDIPSNVFPNLKETDYFFLPEAHRLAFIDKTGFSINMVAKFLIHLLDQAKGDLGEQLEITIITDLAQIEQILSASEIRRLLVSLSYSNADEHEAAAEVIDEWMKETRADSFKNEMIGQINPKSSLVRAMLELASNNGFAEARIKGKDDIRFKNIKTIDYPKKVEIVSEESSLLQKVAAYVINCWRRRT